MFPKAVKLVLTQFLKVRGYLYLLLGVAGIGEGIFLITSAPLLSISRWWGVGVLVVGLLVTGYFWAGVARGVALSDPPSFAPSPTGFAGFVAGSLLFFGVVGGVIWAIDYGDFHHWRPFFQKYHRELVIGGLVGLFLLIYQLYGKVGGGVVASSFWEGFKALPSTFWDLKQLFRALFSPRYLLYFIGGVVVSGLLLWGFGVCSKQLTSSYLHHLSQLRGAEAVAVKLKYYQLGSLMTGLWLWVQLGILEVGGALSYLSISRSHRGE